MKKIVFFLGIFCTFLSYAQNNGTINGNILDLEMNNEPLIMAYVELQNTNIRTETNFHGNFELNNIKPGDYNLVIRYLGYETRIIPVSLKESRQINIVEGLLAKKLDLQETELDIVTKETATEGKFGAKK
ncbi:MAG: carboxypeptidase-like regulatory domain-containing protein [Eudoraea sp.]|nr:carboxypeptidase-like regulatory domain-containing protein [Eudoraea sp.]